MTSDIYNALKQEADAAWAEWDDPLVARISIGISAAALTVGAGRALEAVRRTIDELGIQARILEVGDIGFSWADPVVHIAPPNMPRITYGNIDAETAPQLLRDVLVDGNLRPDLALGVHGDTPIPGADIPLLKDQPWMRDQLRLIMANFGHIEPGNLMHYVANGGLASLDTALHEMTRQDVIDVVRNSGLRGRGGALCSRPASSGASWARPAPAIAISPSTVRRATPARLRTPPSSKMTPTACLRASSSPHTPWARTRAISTSAPNIDCPLNASVAPSMRWKSGASSAITSWARISLTRSRSRPPATPTSAARKRR